MKIPINRLQADRAVRLSFAAVLFISSLALAFLATRPAQSRTANGKTLGDSARARVAPMTPPQVQAAYGKLPLSFEANQGQIDPAVNVVSRGAGYTLFLTPSEVVFVLAGGSSEEAEIIATTVPPTDDAEAAIVYDLPANGANYTAIVRGAGGSTGIAVVEVYALN